MRTALLLGALLSTSFPVFAYNKQALIESFFSIVMVRGYNNTGGLAYGSGVVVAKNKVITNCHVLRTTKQPWISRGQDSFEVSSVKADTWHDLCLISVENLPIKPVKIGSSNTLKRGQEVAGIGPSGSPAPLTSTGSIKGLYEGNPGKVIRTNAKFLMGASGSGLFDMDGMLVGINTFKTAGRGGAIHFTLPVEWLASLEKEPKITTFPITGRALWEEAEDKKPFYMQAAVPESRSDWPKLAQVAEKWIAIEPKNTDAWFTLGLSQEKTGQLGLANTAYKQSAMLDPKNMEALIKIGELAKERGDIAELNRIQIALSKIDQDIGKQYKKFIECKIIC